MKKYGSILAIAALFCTAIVLSGPALAADVVTITGEVNEDYQIVDSQGNAYDVADNEVGSHITANLIGQKVKVTGTVEVDGDIRTITVNDYQVLEE